MAAGIIIPVSHDIYYAEKGNGAFKNEQKIQVSDRRNLRDELVSYGIDYHTNMRLLDREMDLIKLLVQSTRNVRATGSSGLDLSFVAEGKYGGCMVQASKIWDNAAGMLLIQEAGGIHTDILGKPLDLQSTQKNVNRNFTYLAAPPTLHSQLLKLILTNSQT